MESDTGTSSSHLQVKFCTDDEKFIGRLPDDVINVPSSSDPEQLNSLINKMTEIANEDWEPVNFDFLIDAILLRTTLFDFLQTYNIYSVENILKIECIQQSTPPQPHLDLSDSEWVADLKTLDAKTIFSVNFGGQLKVWNIASGKVGNARPFEKEISDEPVKCLEVFRRQEDVFVLTGGQDQALLLSKFESQTGREKSKANLIPKIAFRGHQRSVECLAVNKEGTRAASGSFDKCVKIWNIQHEDEDTDGTAQVGGIDGDPKKKKARMETLTTETPMVTLEAHREAVVAISWSPLEPGRAVTVSWDHQMLVWDLELAGPIASLPSNRAFTSLALNPHNGLALTGSTDPFVRLWDPRSKEGSLVKSTYAGHTGWISDVCWCPDRENLFATSSFDKTVKMWDTRSPKAALYDLMGHQDRVLCVDWSVTERIASGSVDCTLKVFSFL